MENTQSGLVGDLTFTLEPTTGDTDTYRKFNISRIDSTTAVLSMNYTFDFEVLMCYNMHKIQENRMSLRDSVVFTRA